MKKQLLLVLTLSTFLMSACEDDSPRPEWVSVNPTPTLPVSIHSIYPKSAPSGSEVAIFGENFPTTPSDTYVTFDSARAEVTQVRPGFMMVMVPMNLPQGNYIINLTANGRTTSSPEAFTITNEIN